AGILLALVRIHRLPGLRQLAALLVSYTRGTPVLVQLMLMYYVLPGFLLPFGLQGRDLPAAGFVVAAYGLYMGANISEILRGAAAAVPRGQIEAAFSLGMSNRQVLFRIMAPQALVLAWPDFGTILLIGLKSTSLAFSVGVMDMVGRGQALGAQTMRSFEVFLALSGIYYALTLLLESGFRLIEKFLRASAAAPEEAGHAN
ncbi:MAG: amino acid ABC transporter permease, partial [Deltaproteobacteria bacterium]|nr:amino acid ABC transporter permease [Deltaproteobacteria bacterium]